MYARVMTAKVQPGTVEDVTKCFIDVNTEKTNTAKGFRAARLLFNRKTNTAINISIWETEADMTAGGDSPEVVKRYGAAGIDVSSLITETFENLALVLSQAPATPGSIGAGGEARRKTSIDSGRR